MTRHLTLSQEKKEKNPQQLFPGFWIPIEIWKIEGITTLEAMLLSMIDYLHCKQAGGCFASNAFLAEKLKVKENTIKKALVKLRHMDLVENLSFEGRRRIMRAKIHEYLAVKVDLNPSLRLIKTRPSKKVDKNPPNIPKVDKNPPFKSETLPAQQLNQSIPKVDKNPPNIPKVDKNPPFKSESLPTQQLNQSIPKVDKNPPNRWIKIHPSTKNNTYYKKEDNKKDLSKERSKKSEPKAPPSPPPKKTKSSPSKKINQVIRLKSGEYEELCEKFGEKKVKTSIEEMTDYCLAHNKRYKDYAAALRCWMRRDQQKNSEQSPVKFAKEVYRKLKMKGYDNCELLPNAIAFIKGGHAGGVDEFFYSDRLFKDKLELFLERPYFQGILKEEWGMGQG